MNELKEGEKALDFCLKDQDEGDVKSDDLPGRWKWRKVRERGSRWTGSSSAKR